jgi:hypothetical protein
VIKDRLSFMRFLGLGDTVPDANSIWTFREALELPRRGRSMPASFPFAWPPEGDD